MKLKIPTIFTLALVLALSWSCNPTTDNPMPDPPKPLGKGIYILNYGLQNGEGGSLDFYSTDSNRMHRNIFETRNGTDAGKGLSGIAFWKQFAFFTAEKSSVVWVINASTAQMAGRYNRLNDPRKLLIVDAEKTYLSSSTQRGVSVMHTATLQNLGTISLASRVVHFALTPGRAFASAELLAPDGTGKIYVIDYVLDVVIDSIALPGYPASMNTAPDGTLWVLCSGSETAQNALLAINPQTYQIKQQYPLPSYDQKYAGFAFLQQNNIVILAEDVYLLNAGNSMASPQLFISASGRRFTSVLYQTGSPFYYLTGYRPGINDGHLFLFGTNGMVIDSVQTGIMPVVAAFN